MEQQSQQSQQCVDMSALRAGSFTHLPFVRTHPHSPALRLDQHGNDHGVTLHGILVQLAQERATLAEYRRLGIPLPKGTEERIAAMDRAARRKRQEELEAGLAQARRIVEALRGRREKLAEAQATVARIEAELRDTREVSQDKREKGQAEC